MCSRKVYANCRSRSLCFLRECRSLRGSLRFCFTLQLGHQAAQCNIGTINWKRIFGEQAFKLRGPLYFSEIDRKLARKNVNHEELEKRAIEYAKVRSGCLVSVLHWCAAHRRLRLAWAQGLKPSANLILRLLNGVSLCNCGYSGRYRITSINGPASGIANDSYVTCSFIGLVCKRRGQIC